MTVTYALRKLAGQPGRVLQNLAIRVRTLTSWERRYAALREPKRLGARTLDDAGAAAFVRTLAGRGISVERQSIEPDAYRAYLSRADYGRYPLYLDGGREHGFHEKGLEHFLAARLTGLAAGEVCVDVASQHSPVPDIYTRLFGAEMYTQDLAYPPGVEGRRIGGSAAAMPVPDGFADVLVLHNAFEHFEGDADARFMHEAARVLKDGGRLCILPMFVHERFANQTDPAAFSGPPPPFDEGAELWCVKGWHDRFGRFYDVEQLRARLLVNATAFDVRWIDFADAMAFAPGVYLRFAALFRKRGERTR